MTFRFFSRPVGVFGNWSVLILCGLLFLAPFVAPGILLLCQPQPAHQVSWLSPPSPRNQQVADVLGEDFASKPYLLLSWPGCTEADPRLELLARKLDFEVPPNDDGQLADAWLSEQEQARRFGDRLGLLATGTYYQNWGGRNEKWLQGNGGLWYFITPDGEFYRWHRPARRLEAYRQFLSRLLLGNRVVSGELLARFGSPEALPPNPYHADPRRLSARCFAEVITGPRVLRRLLDEQALPSANELRPVRGDSLSRIDDRAAARQRVHERLAGLLFGPGVPSGFRWVPSEFLAALPDETRQQLPADWAWQFACFVDEVVARDFGGTRNGLIAAPIRKQSLVWDALCTRLGIEPPPRPTCLLLTLNEQGQRNLQRVLGRSSWGQPASKLLDLATNECHIDGAELKLGGPSVVAVAAEDEKTLVLGWLLTLTCAISLGLAWLGCGSFATASVLVLVSGFAAAVATTIADRLAGWPLFSDAIPSEAGPLALGLSVFCLTLNGALRYWGHYREALTQTDVTRAAETAVIRSWTPIAVAAVATTLGLVSFHVSDFWSGAPAAGGALELLAVPGLLLAVPLLLLALPAAFAWWPMSAQVSDPDNATEESHSLAEQVWFMVGSWVTRRHWWVTVGGLLLLVAMACGWLQGEQGSQTPRRFTDGSKVAVDHQWLAANFEQLLPVSLNWDRNPSPKCLTSEEYVRGIVLALVAMAGLAWLALRDWQSGDRVAGRFFNPAAGIAAMLPSVLSVVLGLGAWGWAGGFLDVNARLAISLVLGLGLADSVALMQNVQRHFRSGRSRQEALLAGHRSIAPHATHACLILIGVCAVWTQSSLCATQRFGALLISLLAASWLSARILLPALLAGPLGRWWELAESLPPPPASAGQQRESAAHSPAPRVETRHSVLRNRGDYALRGDSGHSWPRH